MPPKAVYRTRKDTLVGGFHLRVGTFEQRVNSSSLTEEQHAHFSEQAEKYSGFRVYRDGLRVMPYGREDNDYFEIEFRRSKMQVDISGLIDVCLAVLRLRELVILI